MLLGMIATSHASGFYGCKIDFETARREAQAVLEPNQQQQTSLPSQAAFSPSSMVLSPKTKKVLENAQLASLNKFVRLQNLLMPHCLEFSLSCAGVKQDRNDYHYCGAHVHSPVGKWIKLSQNHC